MNDDIRMIDDEENVVHLHEEVNAPESVQSDVVDIEKMLKDVEKKEHEIEKHEKLINDLEQKLKERKEELDTLENNLVKRELDIVQNEQDILHKKQLIEQELKEKEVTAHSELESELTKIRIERIALIDSEIEKMFQDLGAKIEKIKSERMETMFSEVDAMLKKAESESKRIITDANQKAQKILNEANKKIQDKEKQLNQKATELEEKADYIETEKRNNERLKKRLERKQEDLDVQEQNIYDFETAKIKEITKNFNSQLSAKDIHLTELRNKITNLVHENEQYASYAVSIGSDPAVIENKMQEYENRINELREEIASRASMDVLNERDTLKKQYDGMSAKFSDLQKNVALLQNRNKELESLELTNSILSNKNEELKSLVNELQESIKNYQQRIERLSASEARMSDRESRIAEINKGYLPALFGAGLPMELSETDWLSNIYNQCNNYGIKFPKRILYAFHTALKISDWSSITVLAGVSGTGKSELPKLYASFGGMNFINVPVQPSWDSQESMLGFFNSIDNRFEPEPLLRFLVQCTENPEYNKYMSIILLDEMNLAHVEHYFADFLSKLETRRGTSKSNVPSIEVKLGAGVQPYQLKLERSLLWTGTMNQDETTKSLSDKVLDRGLVINFPRPRTLSSRKTMAILDKLVEASKRPMLPKKVWGSWIIREINLEGDQLKELKYYKKIVEDINDALEQVGRALGHRVWQSIEHYIINYPTVSEEMAKLKGGEMSSSLRENMKIAFEDQIVQKIMPKLRGVETRGKSKESLDKIETLLEDNGFERLKDDFDIACEQGYGQFIWSSAKYIEAEEEDLNNTPITAKDDE